MSIDIVDKSKCSGCSACYSICPIHCIEMRPDIEGFLYPTIDKSRCIECNICNKVCPFMQKKCYSSNLDSYACINKDYNTRINSSSGGVFSLLADLVLEDHGIVFGAMFDEKYKVVYDYISEQDEVYKLRGSKYVQCSPGDQLVKIKSYLDQGVKVLCTGTPCQIAGIKSFLSKKYDNLICVDFICHGAPSPLVWHKYFEKQRKRKIAHIAFRKKVSSWSNWHVEYTYMNGEKQYILFNEDIFTIGFLSDLYLRPSCYNCPFRTSKRNSDITLADFWGINTLYPDINDDKGISAVIVHNDVGKNSFLKIKDKMTYKQVLWKDIFVRNGSLVYSPWKSSRRAEFFNKFTSKCYDNIEQLILQYSNVSVYEKCLALINNIWQCWQAGCSGKHLILDRLKKFFYIVILWR